MIGHTRHLLRSPFSSTFCRSLVNSSRNFSSAVSKPQLTFNRTLNSFNFRANFATTTTSTSTSTSSGDLNAGQLLEKARTAIDDALKKELNAVYLFQISGKSYLMDAHESRPLRLEEVVSTEPSTKTVDVTMITDEATFLKLAKGEVKPTNAFMTGKLKIKGDMAKAMKAAAVFKAMKV